MKKTNLLKDYNKAELSAISIKLGFKKYNGEQIYRWLFQNSVNSFSEMLNIPKKLQEDLDKNYIINSLKIKKKLNSKIDLTTKFLLETYDSKYLETVSMIDQNRHTVCISSQIGCNIDCDFCATGKMGLTRNLSSGEIIEQLNIVMASINKRVTNIVFMGMGEPFSNYNNVIKACKIFSDSNAFNLSSRRITISTAGILSKIDQYLKEKHKYKLAISLNASNNSFRDIIMPINKKWNIENLISSIKKNSFNYPHDIMFEYVLLENLNDTNKDARRLAKLLKGIKCKINLIPFNEIYGEYKRPSIERINNFSKILHNNRSDYRVFIRWSKGEDIDAACGQLATKNE